MTRRLLRQMQPDSEVEKIARAVITKVPESKIPASERPSYQEVLKGLQTAGLKSLSFYAALSSLMELAEKY